MCVRRKDSSCYTTFMSDSLISQLSNRVQAFLAATGISQRKLAKLIKTDETHLSSFLAGRTGLSAEKSLRLMQILNSTKQQLELKLVDPLRSRLRTFRKVASL
jgi:transcriptional regulator with XRE-family HTH domain